MYIGLAKKGVEMDLQAIGMYFRLIAVVLFMFLAQGCTKDDQPLLQDADKRFAAFYADYLLLSGIASSEPDNVSLVDGKYIDSLLVVHALTIEDFNKLVDTYKDDPRLWRAVLREVKNKLQKDER